MSKYLNEICESLKQLTQFQRNTVKYVYKRFYEDDDKLDRFLVADEVGLGKTMVARGIIGYSIKKFWNCNRPINFVYVGSNQAIVAQNIEKLVILSSPELTCLCPTRMTLLPIQKLKEKRHEVNVISLTPGTTFNIRKSMGRVEERALLFKMLSFKLQRSLTGKQKKEFFKLFQGRIKCEKNWNDYIEKTIISKKSKFVSNFLKDVSNESIENLKIFCKKGYNLNKTKSEIISDLRYELALSNSKAFKPDLIIFDEFHRFPDLLEDKGKASNIIRELTNAKKTSKKYTTKTLLLSATPFKMLTLREDQLEGHSHFREFNKLLNFLEKGYEGSDLCEFITREMKELRRLFNQLPESKDEAFKTKQKIENVLRKVMSRTERLANHNKLLMKKNSKNNRAEEKFVTLIEDFDLDYVKSHNNIASKLEVRNIIEFWKSSPYILNFMTDYTMKKKLERKVNNELDIFNNCKKKNKSNKEIYDELDLEFIKLIELANETMLPISEIQDYSFMCDKVPNGRMRKLIRELLKDKPERHLWLSPTIPYYESKHTLKRHTKTLVFSAWRMVPNAIVALLSYETERRIETIRRNNATKRNVKIKHRSYKFSDYSGLIDLPHKTKEDVDVADKFIGLNTMNLIYPSPMLASLVDPLTVNFNRKKLPKINELNDIVNEKLFQFICKKISIQEINLKQNSFIPVAIDEYYSMNTNTFFEYIDKGRENTINVYKSELMEMSQNRMSMKKLKVLCKKLTPVIIGSPGICALRSLKRMDKDCSWDDPLLVSEATKIALGFRTMFNRRDSYDVVNAVVSQAKFNGKAYWEKILQYCIEHNIQSTLDEYVHNLIDGNNLLNISVREKIRNVSKIIQSSLTIRQSSFNVDEISTSQLVNINKFNMRGKFAMRLSEKDDVTDLDEVGGESKDNKKSRISNICNVFNSPFRPFVLATTSIGQEGLDFHTYCNQVYHWNLPKNPIDLEQREGRVNRYKSHAVRMNLAEYFSKKQFRYLQEGDDIWSSLFRKAKCCDIGNGKLSPYWILPGKIQLNRKFLMLEYSREIAKLDWLISSLAVYRLTFGQQNQEELLNLLQKLNKDKIISKTDIQNLQINLEPR